MTDIIKPTALSTLIHIAKTHNKKLSLTFALAALENGLFLLYPLVGGFAVNAVLNGQTWNALAYALMVLAIWAVGSVNGRWILGLLCGFMPRLPCL